MYGLYHHDCVIHNRTDSKHQGKQRQQVDTESRNSQTRKRTLERNDDSYSRNKCGLEILQEEIHHQYHQDNCDNQRLLDIGHRSQQEVIRARQLAELQSSRQGLAQLLQLVAQGIIRFLGVCTCNLETQEAHRRIAVTAAAERVACHTQLHVSHIPQTQDTAIILGHQHNILELLDISQTTRIFQRVLEHIVNILAAAVSRLLAKCTRRALQVLFGQRIRNHRWRHPVLGHGVGLHPYTQRIRTAKRCNITHALDTFKLRQNIDI